MSGSLADAATYRLAEDLKVIISLAHTPSHHGGAASSQSTHVARALRLSATTDRHTKLRVLAKHKT